jgi:nucleotide-binding universal stress UspA family protein
MGLSTGLRKVPDRENGVAQRLVVAMDESSAGEAALRTAIEIESHVSAEIIALHVIAAPAATVPVIESSALPLEEELGPVERFRNRVEYVVRLSGTPIKSRIAHGLPGIEICRFAENVEADLIVLGRKRHCARSRLLLGDTTDAVARRSHLPALFVPASGSRLQSMLVALDGSDRGLKVLEQACSFARELGAKLQAVTVESGTAVDTGLASPPITRTLSHQARAVEILARQGFPDVRISVRRGSVVQEVLEEVRRTQCDVLVIGHHRGGTAWAVQAGSHAQSLGHEAPCAVLTVPL